MMDKRETKLIIEKINAIQQLFLFDVWIYNNRKKPEDTKTLCDDCNLAKSDKCFKAGEINGNTTG